MPVLDGWRALAIGSVLLHHAVQGFYATEDAYASSLTQYGAFGVDIFFGLSGILITRLLLREWDECGSLRLREFYIRRTFRILPPCLVFLAVYTALGLWQSKMELVSSLFFFRNYVPSLMTGFGSGHLWSLAVEEHFYLLWPGLLAICGPKRSGQVAAALALGFGLWRMVESQISPPLFPEIPAHFRTDLRLDALLWGCVVAFSLNNDSESKKLASQLRFPGWFAAVCILALSIRYYSPLTSVFVAVLIPAVLAGTLLHPEWWISRLLSLQPLAWLGRISYSLYLWQQVFLVPGWEPGRHVWQQWPWNIVLALSAACLSYYAVEQPLIALGRRLAIRSRHSLGLSESSTVPAALAVDGK
jgi:peptidoglycan/LPS O-acetylase OafA/YrhL